MDNLSHIMNLKLRTSIVVLFTIIATINPALSLCAAAAESEAQFAGDINIGHTLELYREALRDPSDPDNKRHITEPINVEGVKQELNWDAVYDPSELRVLAKYIEKSICDQIRNVKKRFLAFANLDPQYHATNARLDNNLVAIEYQIVAPMYHRQQLLQLGHITVPKAPKTGAVLDLGPLLNNYRNALDLRDERLTLLPINEAQVRKELNIDKLHNLAKLESLRDALTHLHNNMSMRYTEYHGEKIIETEKEMEKPDALLANIQAINDILNSIQKRIRKLKLTKGHSSQT